MFLITNEADGFTVKVFGKKIFSFHSDGYLLKNLYSNIISHKEHPNKIYIYKHHIGEIFVFIQLLSSIIKKNNGDIGVIVTQKRYVDLYKIFCPEVKTYLFEISNETIDKRIKKELYNIKEISFVTPHLDRFEKLREMIKQHQEGAHFYSYIRTDLGIAEDEQPIKYRDIMIPKGVSFSVFNKAREAGLDLEKIVVLYPEAVTASALSMKFWVEVTRYLAEKGYGLYINSSNPKYLMLPGVKHFPLTIAEIAYLTTKSRGVVALINGLVCCFAGLNIPRIFVYTQQTPTVGYRMTASDMLESYRLDKIPQTNTDNLYEIDGDENSEADVVELIKSIYK